MKFGRYLYKVLWYSLADKLIFEQRPKLNLREQAKGISIGRASREKRKYKDPEVRAQLKCAKNSKVASMMQVIKRRVAGDEIGEIEGMWGQL